MTKSSSSITFIGMAKVSQRDECGGKGKDGWESERNEVENRH